MSHLCLIVATPMRDGVRDALYPFWDDDRDEGPAQPHFVFITDKHADINPSTRKPGYWRNPQGKWNGWTIGGNWAGLFAGEDQIEASALVQLLDDTPDLLGPVYATLINGEWREASKHNDVLWSRDLRTSLLSLPPQMWLTVVDCHC